MIKYSLLESSHQGGSNNGKSVFLVSIDDKLDLFERTHNILSSSN